MLDEERHVEPSERDAVDREGVTRDQARRLSVKDLPPGGTGASRRRPSRAGDQELALCHVVGDRVGEEEADAGVELRVALGHQSGEP